ncbi:MAG: hypothetical protein LBV71_07830 [Prevotella sp.]|nr:hypothetical protein [Prevotella sp.]
MDLRNGEQIFIRDLGCQTVNIGEFLGIIETGYEPKIIYSDSLTATIWINNKKIASKKILLGIIESRSIP